VRSRKAPENSFPVGLGREATIEDCDDPAIRLPSDQAPEALLERESSQRDEVVHERVLSFLLEPGTPCDDERIGRYIEGQLIDHDEAQRISWDIHTLPKAHRRKKDRVAIAPKLVKDFLLWRLALYQNPSPDGARAKLGE
jgi:hypothetical protein